MKRIILAALVGMLVSGPARAAESMTIKDFLNYYDQSDRKTQVWIERVFDGAGDAFSWTNTYLSDVSAYGTK
jgi:hypothetical protein